MREVKVDLVRCIIASICFIHRLASKTQMKVPTEGYKVPTEGYKEVADWPFSTNNIELRLQGWSEAGQQLMPRLTVQAS